MNETVQKVVKSKLLGLRDLHPLFMLDKFNLYGEKH